MPAEAKGCLKGAIVGGVAGHVAGHGKLGAAAGCVVGHHEASKPNPNNRTRKPVRAEVTDRTTPMSHVQCPKERKPIFFMRAIHCYPSLFATVAVLSGAMRDFG